MASRRGNARSRAIGKVKLGQKKLGLADAEYRGLLERVTGLRSAKDLKLPDLGRVIEEMDRLGAYGLENRRPRGSAETEAQIGKIVKLLDLDGKPISYAQAILKRQTKHPHLFPLTWATPKQLRGVIAALEKDRQRRAKRREKNA